MWAARAWCRRFWAARYWPKIGSTTTVTLFGQIDDTQAVSAQAARTVTGGPAARTVALSLPGRTVNALTRRAVRSSQSLRTVEELP